MERIRVFIGHDGAESQASMICQKSIQRRTQSPLEVIQLNQAVLRDLGLYSRARDPLASTEFTYTRFLVPALCGYQGHAIFVDADFLFQADIAELWALRDPHYAVQVVQHDYTPTETTKMGGVQQTQYPRKNWSSLILWNCGSRQNQIIDLERVNTATGAFLHRFEWLHDSNIGSLPIEWNWLEPMGEPPKMHPKAIHFTMGIPDIHPGEFHFADCWREELRAINE